MNVARQCKNDETSTSHMTRNGNEMPDTNSETQSTCLNTEDAYVRCSM